MTDRLRVGWVYPHNALRSPFIKFKAEPWKVQKIPLDQSIHTLSSLAAHKFPCAHSLHKPFSLYLGPVSPKLCPSCNFPWKWVVALSYIIGERDFLWWQFQLHWDPSRCSERSRRKNTLWRARINNSYHETDGYLCSSRDFQSKLLIVVNLKVTSFNKDKQEVKQLQTHLKGQSPYLSANFWSFWK